MTDETTFEEMVADEFSLEVFSYDGEIAFDFWTVLSEISRNRVTCTDDIAKKHRLPQKYVQLIQYIICNNGNAEYGTSPRCCWLTGKGEELFRKLEPIAREAGYENAAV